MVLDNKSKKYSLVLGSQSPRRKELLGWAGIPFSIVVADLEEVSDEIDPAKFAMDIASQKAHAVIEKCSVDLNPFIISSDTIVVLNEKIYGKPKDRNDARKILSELSNHTHYVITGVSFIFKDSVTQKRREHLFYDLTEVRFNEITDDLMDAYLDTGDSLDKAGAYGIQGPSLTFISSIKGSYSNVVGFPLDKVIDELKIVLGSDWKAFFV